MCPRSLFQRIAALLGISSNFLLILLIVSKSSKKLGSYKYLMIYISVFEILYAILDALVVPKMFSRNSGALILILVEDAWLPQELLLLSNVIYCTFFGISMAIFAIHFIYRYLVVSGSEMLKSNSRKVTACLLGFPIIFGMFWSLLTYFTMSPFQEADLFLQRQYLTPNERTLSDISYIGLYFYPENEYGEETINWRTMTGFAVQGCFINISLGLIFYFGRKCYRFTSSKSTHSTGYEALQSQLFYALAFQTLIPLFLMHIPSAVGFFAAFSNVSIEFLSELLSCTIALYPALDPLPSIFIIKNYRKAIVDCVRAVFLKFTCRQKTFIMPMVKHHNSSRISVI